MRLRHFTITLSSMALLALSLPSISEAGGGRGWDRGGRGPMKRCMRFVMHAHPDMLKAKLGLDDAQISKIKAIRNNFANKRVDMWAAAQKERIKLHTLFEADLPDEHKVLQRVRKIRGIRGKLKEELIKAHLKILRVLSKQQRTTLRSRCLAPGRFTPGRGLGVDGDRGCPFCGRHGQHGRRSSLSVNS